MKDTTLSIPLGMMTSVEAARTFTAYLIGALAHENNENQYGPYRMGSGDESWQLDGTNDFWLHIEGAHMLLRCRYEREVPIIKAAANLYRARYLR